jgi:hypothetical protein
MQIYGDYDVVVVGGGVSGCSAAIASARTGAKTILIERFGALGGMMNVSGPPGWAYSHLWNERGEQIVGGIVQETHDRLEKEGHALPFPKPEDRNFNNAYSFVDPDWWGLLIFQMLKENNVELLLHSMAVEALKEGDKAVGIVVENTGGRMAVLGKVIIEATGEGDIAVRAGVPYTKVDRTKEEIDPPSITFHMDGVDWDKVTAYMKANPEEYLGGMPVRLLNQKQEAAKKQKLEELQKCKSLIDLVMVGKLGTLNFPALTKKALDAGDFHPYGDLGFFFTPRDFGHIQPIFQHSGQVPDCDCTNIKELSAGETEARRQVAISLKAAVKYLPGFEKAYFTRLTTCVRTREGRHMVGDYQLNSDDVEQAKKFKDVVAKSGMPTSSGGPFHSTATPGNSMNVDTTRKFSTPKDGGSFDIPFRSMIPKNVDGMIMVGKLVSVTEDFKRDLLPENMCTGQAGGIAAALCAKKGITPRQMESDVSELQTILVKQGAILYNPH